MDDAATIPGPDAANAVGSEAIGSESVGSEPTDAEPADAKPADAKSLDLRGLKCPMPVLHTRRALRRLAVGRTLRILTTDPLAAIDIPHLARQDGHLLTETAQGRDGVTIFSIVKQAG